MLSFSLFSFVSGRFLRCALPAVLCLPLIAQASDNTQVFVTPSIESTTGFTLTFEHPPRVSQLVSESAAVIRPHLAASAHQSNVIDWQGAALFNHALSPETAQLLDSVKQDLKTLRAEWADDPTYANAVDALIDYVENATFRERLPLPLDEDHYLAGSHTNPLVTGKVTLILPSRAKQVSVIGAVTQPHTLPFTALTSAREYLAQSPTLNHFGISNVAVISPNGELAIHHTAYWNAQHQNVAPGAVIFVPFQRLPFGLASLNDTLPRLLQHRVM